MTTTWGSLTTSLLDSAKDKKVPIVGAFELTARCNFQCKMCYVCRPASCKHSISRERSTDEWISLAEEIRDAGALFVTLTGGEIFLRKDIQEIYESMTQMGYRITLYTNGSLITPELAKWLSKIPPALVSVTLYGGSEKTYEEVCGNPQGFGMTLKGIDALLEEGIKVELKTTIVRGNYHDYDKMAALAKERGLVLEMVDYISPRREGEYSDPVGERLNPSEFVRFVQYVEEYKRSQNTALTSRSIEDSINAMDIKVVENEKFRNSQDAFRCTAGKCGFWISWDGRLLPCGLLNEPSSQPIEIGFNAAWDELIQKCSRVPDCKDCKKCELLNECRYCAARLVAETGSFEKPAPYVCEYTRETMRAKESKPLKVIS